MMIPPRVDARWISTLGDTDLLVAERALHDDFRLREQKEKALRGGRYVLLNGPSTLVDAWQRWLLVSNAARARGLSVRHHG
ncbi:MAG TPA: hypothetical protein VGQ44_11360 [Gemmatimonadaceae bacterium]|nr:hypothetical protein [Gemmatimonadaceae bacterium]